MNQPGWYEDPSDPALVRWWDGSAWTSEARAKAAVEGGMAAGSAPERPKKPFYRRTWVLVTGGVVVLFIVIGVLGGSGADKVDTAAAATGSSSEPAAESDASADAAASAEASAKAEQDRAAEEARKAEEAAAATAAAEKAAADAAAAEQAAAAAAAEEAARGTVSQQNAFSSAEDYLSFTAFSRSGLADQLAFEGFSAEDAEFAIARLEGVGGVDWNEQAAKSAANYLSFTSFSHSGLVDQLTFEGFTPEQAEYGVGTTGL